VIGPGAGVRGPNPTLPISEIRVCEDGVKLIKPEAKCDWARDGCSGAQFPRLCGKPVHRGASNQNREGQVLGVQYPTLWEFIRDSL
jgi:hypothetical protein